MSNKKSSVQRNNRRLKRGLKLKTQFHAGRFDAQGERYSEFKIENGQHVNLNWLQESGCKAKNDPKSKGFG